MKKFWTFMIIAATLVACQQEDDVLTTDPIPDGKGRVTMTIKARRPAPATRAETGNWLDPVDPVERIHDYKVIFVNGSNEVVEMVSNTISGEDGVEQDEFRFHLAPGTYTVYGFANLTAEQWTATGITVPVKNPNGEVTTKGSLPADFATRTINTTNGWDKNIPMTSRTGGQQITVVAGENQTFAVEVVRTMAKLQIEFTNNSGQEMDILGYEIYPLTETNNSLLEPATPADIIKPSKRDTVAFAVDLKDKPIKLVKTNGTGMTTVYVNESSATATGVENQYSIRLKAKRYLESGGNQAEATEYRYGMTVNHASGGFTNICRNDWIKIPITFGDWSFRIEALQFVPIAGYQTTVVSADALTATFLTGGNICIKPMVRKNTDAEGTWRNIFDNAVTFSPKFPFEATGTDKTYTVGSKTFPYNTRYEALSAPDGQGDQTGIILTGDTYILTQDDESNLFMLLDSGDIVGQLQNEDAMEGTLTLTLLVKLEGRLYSFSYNIVKALNPKG